MTTRRARIAVITLVLGAALLGRGAVAGQQPTFRAGIDLVNFGVTATDRKGTFIDDLTIDDFEIVEDGKKQTPTYFARGDQATSAPPLHIGLLFDTSGSMGEDIKLARSAAVRFLNTLSDAVDMTLVDFDTEVRVARYGQKDFPRMVERIRSRQPGGWTAMYDALGRQAYALDAGWTGHRARPDWHAAYAYDRWRPTLFTAYSDDTDPIRGGTVRSQELFAGALLPFRHLRWTETLQAGFDAQTDTVTCTTITATCRTPDRRRDLRSVRGGWLHDSRRLFGYSISPEEGFAVEAAAETSRTALGSDADAGAGVFDVRAYQRLFGRHTVLAGRFAAAAGWGPRGARRVFSAGGAGPSYLVFDFGRDTIGLLRGFSPEDLVGSRAMVANLDLRFPLARIERGVRSWPIFFRALHGAAFVDAGEAWDSAFRAADLRTSTGAELSLHVVVFHYLPLTLVSGAAWTRDPVAGRNHGAVFGRVGYAV